LTPYDEQETGVRSQESGDAPETPETQRLESEQLRLSAAEITRLGVRIRDDYENALIDHNRRMERWAEYLRSWNGTPDVPKAGEEDHSNFPVPYIRWNVKAKWAKEMDALFGDGAQIVAEPVGPSDYRKDKKIGLYMTWRVFNRMKLLSRLCTFVFRKILFGKSFAYSPYVRRTYTARGQEIVDYEGPDFVPLWPDDMVLPAEEHETIHEFSWVIRRYRASPEDLLDGEQEGRYFSGDGGITDSFQEILNLARQAAKREPRGEEIKVQQDEAEGLQMFNPQSAGDSLLVLEWYGRWRMLKSQSQDGDEYSLLKREAHQADLVVRYMPDLNRVIGVQDLAELYPDIKDRRPFVEGSMLKDGSTWPAGLGKMLIDLEDELRSNHNLGTDAGEHTVGPLIFYRPATGMDSEAFEYTPKMMIPVDNPSSDVKVERLTANIEFVAAREQTLLAYGERLHGMSDLSLGRASDRPNAPRTARGTVALLEEGNVLISLDSTVLREDMGLVLGHFWDLEQMFSPPSVFFRVTEDDADGLFPVRDGGSMLEKKDRDGRYDFKLQFAKSYWSREADKERTIQRYGLDIQNPLIVQNPSALWKVTCDVHEALGDPNFASIVPEPPEPDLPVNPKEEFNRLLQGEDIHVNPLDNDELHLIRHARDLATVDPVKQPEVHQKLTQHYLETIDQLQHKKVVQALTERALETLQQRLPPQVLQMLTQAAQLGAQPGAQPGGAPGGPPAPGAPQQ
jgi:hypothetical protein